MMAPEGGVREPSPRFLVALPAKVTVADHPVPGAHRVFTAVTANISDGGMALDLQEALPPWTPVEVQVEAAGGTVVLEAVVLWHEDLSRLRGSSGIRHGFMLSQIPPGARQGWDGLLKGLGHVTPSTRRHTRFPLDARAVCALEGRGGAHLEGRVENVSCGGLGLLLPERLPAGTGLELEVLTRGEHLRMAGRVVWSSPLPVRTGGPAFRHGVEREAGDWPHDFVLDMYLQEGQWRVGLG
ncbi:MAG: PilZ domain-containing protein [candidate division NC10 bacterium]|nr:PilZ domain-containing protein [candidate division NC10 bacterium]